MYRKWTTLVPLCIQIQCSVVSWRYLLYNSLGSFIQRYASGTSSDNEWINILRFLINVLLLFALTSGGMRNDLFVFKIIIPTPLTKMTIRSHSRSLAISCCHSLLLVVPLVVTSCYSSYHLLSFVVTWYSTRLSCSCYQWLFPRKCGPLLHLILPETLLKRDSIMDILSLNVLTFFSEGGGAISQNSSDYLQRCLFV